MPQILGVEGEAVVLYREPSTTQEMRYPRLSLRVNKMAVFLCFQDATCSGFQHSIKNNEIACICNFLAYVAILFMQLRGLLNLLTSKTDKTYFLRENIEDFVLYVNKEVNLRIYAG